MAVRLSHTLGLVVAMAGACGGRIAPSDDERAPSTDDTDGGAPATTDEECPHTVELRSFDVSVPRDEACGLAEAAPPCFGYYCLPSPQQCASACGDSAANRCALPLPFLRAFRSGDGVVPGGDPCPPSDPSLTLHCSVTERRGSRKTGCAVSAAGRRPCGLVDGPEAQGSALATYFTDCARLEGASVIAFEELAASLADLGAPRDLIDRCLVASQQEIQHERATFELARRFGATNRQPIERSDVSAHALLDLARENMVEGIVRETFGAAVAAFQATYARDERARRELAVIARDECEHAELATSIAAFFDARLGESERESLRSARDAAIAELRRTFDPPSELCGLAGLPNAAEARKILDELNVRVWV